MKNDYTLVMSNGVGIVKSDMLSAFDVNHGFTTRLGGRSLPPIDTLNFGFNRPEPSGIVTSNYRKLCYSYGLDYDSLVLVSYVHGTNVIEVTRNDCGRGIQEQCKPLEPCDGIVTNDPSVTLFTLHADCSALFVFDPVTKAVGLAHAGWRGTYGRIGGGLVSKLSECYGAVPSDMYAVVSPCICEKCYEVGADVAQMFEKEFGIPPLAHSDSSKAYLDIRRAAEIGFLDAGLAEAHIASIPCCTYENDDLFYSFRRDGRGKTGAMGAFIRLGA